MNKSTRKIGQQLEYWVLDKIKQIDPKAKLTNNSGACSQRGDIDSSIADIECKVRNTEDFTIREDVWKHLLYRKPIGSKKISFMVNQNKNNLKIVSLDAETFFELLERVYNNE